MRKCPDCAEENINESLFCKRCGRCLLPPDPTKIDLSNSRSPGAGPLVVREELELWVQRSAATHIEHHKTPEGIDFFDSLIVKNSGAVRLKRRRRAGLSVYREPLMLLTLLVVILISHIIVILMSR
jgi:hypothetical protein